MKITIDLEKVALQMLAMKANDLHDGYTNCLVDVLEEIYEIETKLQQWIPDDFMEDNEPEENHTPYACNNCGKGVSKDNMNSTPEGEILCNDCWEEL